MAVPFGLYDTTPVTDAASLGAPLRDRPGVDLIPGRAFWTLLPAFMIVTIVGAEVTGVAARKAIRATLDRRGILTTIPPARREGRQLPLYDWEGSRRRHLVENLFAHLKQFRRLATRYLTGC